MDVQQTQTSGIKLSKDPQCPGLDLHAAQSWIYPTNYPVRDYQLNIVQNALFKNTLVSLPTGLGKTFIAAVVMYNFYRWYPEGKVIFMAPTRPLVKQQIDACYDIMAIPKKTTAELTGTNVSGSREDIWNEKRVFFITPQILQNDLERIADIGAKIRCLVFDEAHKARGKHAYCEVVRKLMATNKYFRVLALSATPGASISDVLEVIHNLLISHLEFRTEESSDVQSYVFERNITTVVVPLGDKLQQVKEDYLEILEYHTRTLIKYKVIQGNWGSLTKGKIFITMKNFQQNCRGTGAPNYAEIMKCLNICVTLYHGFELLIRHGLRGFLTFFEEHIDKPLLRGNTRLISIMDDVKKYLGPPLNLERLPDGDYTKVSKDVKFGHPKFYKLQEILLENFNEKHDNSKVIVFFEYRDSVMEAYALLSQFTPVLKPRIFLGQKNGITQKSQINVVKAFREGLCNILLSTSIGEEGLDVGEVDLIICFDISNKSPIRMIQRIGRTGRKKKGSVIVLVTEGKEQQTLKDCLIHKNNITQHVLSSREIAKSLCSDCPRLMPDSVDPKCEKMYITVEKTIPKKGATLKDIFRSVSSSSIPLSFSPDLEIVDIVERLPKTDFLWNKSDPLGENVELSNVLSKKIQKQRSFQETCLIQHSKDTEIFVNLLQSADLKRYNIPSTQIGNAVPGNHNKNLKQADIRNMFFKSQSSNDFDPISQVSDKPLDQPTHEEKSNLGTKEFFDTISDYVASKMCDRTKKCRHCPTTVNCESIKMTEQNISINWEELDKTVYTSITLQGLLDYKRFLNKTDEHSDVLFEDDINFENIDVPTQKIPTQKVLELDDLIDKSILADFFNESVAFEPPKSLKNILNKYNVEEEVKTVNNAKKSSGANDSVVYEGPSKTKISKKYLDDILSFFKVISLEEIYSSKVDNSQDTIVYSPDMFEQSPNADITIKRNEINDIPVSPILGKYSQKMKPSKPNLQKLKSKIESPTKFSMDRTKISSTPQVSTQAVSEKCPTKNTKELLNNLELNELCDMSLFGLVSGAIASPLQAKESTSLVADVSNEPKAEDSVRFNQPRDSNDGCDISPSQNFFENIRDFSFIRDSEVLNQENSLENLAPNLTMKTNICQTPQKSIQAVSEKFSTNRTKGTINNLEIDEFCDISSFGLNLGTVPSSKSKDSSSNVADVVNEFRGEDFCDPAKPNNQRMNKACEISPSQRFSQNLVGSYSKTQVGNAQLVSSINPPSPNCVLNSKKKKIEDICDLDSFNFSFNEKKSPIKRRKIAETDLTGSPKRPAPASPRNSYPSKNNHKKQSDVSRSITTQSKPTQSQMGITQLLSMINKPTQNSSQNSPRRKINDPDLYSFSFNQRKTPNKNSQTNSDSQLCSGMMKSPTLTCAKSLFTSCDKMGISGTKTLIPKTIAQCHDLSNMSRVENELSSEDEFEPKQNRSLCRKKSEGPGRARDSKRPKKKKRVNDFIEDEAELSICDTVLVSDDEFEEASQSYDASFIADETHNHNTQMHLRYLQSVRSPVIKNRGFKIPDIRNVKRSVYSQDVTNLDDTYLDDSFVVREGEEDESIQEFSELELLEMKLEKQKRRKVTDNVKPVKRKRIIYDDDSD